ncbi:MAG: hypothetical protein SH807_03365 [Blastochloris sp.]|nr:hypothetical protein [Blastochloris sp.]
MSKARRSEIWMADLGFVAKVRPALILSVEYLDEERSVVTFRICGNKSLRATN